MTRRERLERKLEQNEIRTYWRCTGCLAVIASDDVTPATRIVCDCGDRLSFMGQVGPSGNVARMFRTTQDTPCDDRCTFASGPNCDCQCGGKNHGTKRLVTKVTYSGTVPTLHATTAEALKQKHLFEQTIDEIFDDLDRCTDCSYTKYRASIRVPSTIYYLCQQVHGEISRAKTLKSWRGRFAALTQVCQVIEDFKTTRGL